MRRKISSIVVAIFVFSLTGVRHIVHDSLKFIYVIFLLFISYLTEDIFLSMKKTNQFIPFNKIIASVVIIIRNTQTQFVNKN